MKSYSKIRIYIKKTQKVCAMHNFHIEKKKQNEKNRLQDANKCKFKKRKITSCIPKIRTK